MVQVESLMTKNIVTLSGNQTLRDAIAAVQKYRIRHLPVVNGTHIVGIVTDRDIKRATPSLLSGVDQEEYERVLSETKVFQVMTREPITVEPSTPLATAIKLLVEKKFGALPVVENGKLVGIVTDTDVLRGFLAMLESAEEKQARP
jgi:acetoin utilization protein AcuB